MKKLLLALTLCLLAVPAWAQCNGLFQPGYVCGNTGALPAPPLPQQVTNFPSYGIPVIKTVCPNSASTADKAHCNFVGDGANDQVAVNNAFAAATASNSYAEVWMLPGTYVFSAAAVINCNSNGFVFDSRGTFTLGPGGTTDTFNIKNCNNARFDFGVISAPGAASAIHSVGNYIQTTITFQELVGAAQAGNGVYIDATGLNGSQGVNQIYGTNISSFNYGIVMVSTENIDTYRVTVDYIYHNNIDILVNSSESGSIINSNTWNVNLDCSWTTSVVCLNTNEEFSVFNLIVGGLQSGSNNLILGSGAQYNIFNVTPYTLWYNASVAASIVNNSGNTTNGGLVAPVVCSGSPTSSFVTDQLGRVTHC